MKNRAIVVGTCAALCLAALCSDGVARRARRHVAHHSAAVTQKQSELARLRSQIGVYEQQLAKLERTEHSSLAKLDAYSRQTQLLRTLIRNLNDEEARLTGDIASTEKEISESERQLREMKAQYARAVVALYKRGSESDVELLLTSHSMTEAIERTEYLRRFGEYRRELAANIASTVSSLREQRAALTEQRDEKAADATEKLQREQMLATQAEQRAKLIDRLRADKSSVKQTLAQAKQSSHQIESLIAKLVAQDLARQRAAKTARRSSRHATDRDFEDVARTSRASESSPPSSTTPAARGVPRDASGFGALCGSLHWPCASRRIAQRFGEHTNPALGTVTVNLGVDIHTPKLSNVLAVADGIVTLVYWLPSFGSMVILDHHGGYRTVYANLAQVTVKQGEHVRAQQPIGRSDASVDAGEVVHFEIWKDREKQNPEAWLRR